MIYLGIEAGSILNISIWYIILGLSTNFSETKCPIEMIEAEVAQ